MADGYPPVCPDQPGLAHLERPAWGKAAGSALLPLLYAPQLVRRRCHAPPYVHTRIIDEVEEALDFDLNTDLVGISFMTYNC